MKQPLFAHRFDLVQFFFFAVLLLWHMLSLRLGGWNWGPGAPLLRTVLSGIAFVLHAGLYEPYLQARAFQKRVSSYLAVQSILIVLIGFLSFDWLVAFGLYLVLSARAILLLWQRELTLKSLAGYLLFCGCHCASLTALLILYVEDGADWHYFTLMMLLLPLFISFGGYVLFFQRQMAQRRQTECLLAKLGDAHGELERSHAQLAAYAVEVEELTLANERQRMARELHDTLTQGLAGLIFQLEAADALLVKQKPEQAREILRQAMQRARTTFAEARYAITDLRGGQGGEQDICVALQEEVRQFTHATDIPCKTEIRALVMLPFGTHEHVKRVIREGLLNIARHAQAQKVSLVAAYDEGMFHIELCDDGRGLDAAANAQRAGHYGFVGLRERARLLHGELEVTGRTGGGTRLCLRFPHQQGEEAGI
jgi:NarL family two-component system sensor histidine kinase YdfH